MKQTTILLGSLEKEVCSSVHILKHPEKTLVVHKAEQLQALLKTTDWKLKVNG